MLGPSKQALTLTLKKTLFALTGLGLIAVGFIVYVVYYGGSSSATNNTYNFINSLPKLNACFNGLSATFVICGLIAIKRKSVFYHRMAMISALLFSCLFLVSYLVYHYLKGDTHFVNTGLVAIFYYFILITHIVLSMVIVPLILITVFLAIKNHLFLHRKFAKITYPLWLYVSITGIIVYLMLYVLPMPNNL